MFIGESLKGFPNLFLYLSLKFVYFYEHDFLWNGPVKNLCGLKSQRFKINYT